MKWKMLVCGCVAVMLLFGFAACRTDESVVEAVAPANTPPISATAAPVVLTEAPTATPSPEQTPEPTPELIDVLGQSYTPDAETIAVTMPIDSYSELNAAIAKLPALHSIDVDFGNTVWSDDISAWFELLAWEEAQPALTFRNIYPAESSPETATVFVPTAGVVYDWETMLAHLPALELIDSTNTPIERETIAAILSERPDVIVRWTDAYFGASDSSVAELAFGETPLSELMGYLSCLPRLTDADLYACPLSTADGLALKKAFPSVRLHRNITLNGNTYDSMTTYLDLSNAKIADADAFSDELGGFEALAKIELHNCSLTYPQLDLMNKRYPNTKVVWTVKFNKWRVRTDAVAFSTMQPGRNDNRQTAKNLSALQYCTDLIVLDLGHNAVSDLSWMKSLSNLQVLILADNSDLRDISVLRELKHLKYVELFMNPITDISVLGELPELVDVNLCITRVADLTPLLQCKKLERIWIGAQTQEYCSKESLDAVLAAFPNAQYDLTSVSSTNLGWREHPRYDAFRSMLRDNIPVEPFLPVE